MHVETDELFTFKKIEESIRITRIVYYTSGNDFLEAP